MTPEYFKYFKKLPIHVLEMERDRQCFCFDFWNSPSLWGKISAGEVFRRCKYHSWMDTMYDALLKGEIERARNCFLAALNNCGVES